METKTAPTKNGESTVKITKPENDERTIARRQDTPLFNIATPFTFMRRFADDMERMFDDWGFAPSRFTRMLREEPKFTSIEEFAFAPQIETIQKDDHFIVRADLPGVNKEDVHVEVKDNALELSGERKQEKEEKGENYFRSEKVYGSFFRRIPLPEGANAEKAKATFRDGVLEISVKAPKQVSNGKKIEIS